MCRLQRANSLAPLLLFALYLSAIVPTYAQANSLANAAVVSASSAAEKLVVQPRSSWGAKPAKPYKMHQPNRITIHHEGGKVLSINQDAAQRLRNIQHWCMGPDRQWADIPYHFLIAPDGTVYQGRDVFTVGESNTSYDPTGHLHISFLGNYNEQSLDENLLHVLTVLIAQLCKTYSISPKTITGHLDHYPQTTCPSEEIYQHIKDGSLERNVQKLLSIQ